MKLMYLEEATHLLAETTGGQTTTYGNMVRFINIAQKNLRIDYIPKRGAATNNDATFLPPILRVMLNPDHAHLLWPLAILYLLGSKQASWLEIPESRRINVTDGRSRRDFVLDWLDVIPGTRGTYPCS